jgi:hypothetical protein
VALRPRRRSCLRSSFPDAVLKRFFLTECRGTLSINSIKRARAAAILTPLKHGARCLFLDVFPFLTHNESVDSSFVRFPAALVIYRQRIVFFVLVLFLLLSPLLAKTKATPAVDGDYISALATANQFLIAWQNHDQETGLVLLSNDAKQHTSEDRLQAFFSRGTGREAFEIGHGTKLKVGRYSFPVTLFGVPGRALPTSSRRVQLLVARTGKDDWAVDRLP